MFLFFREEKEEEDDKPRPNVYIPPNLRKKELLEEQDVILDRAADGSEIVETAVVEAPVDVRTDPDGQSSEPEVAKDQPIAAEVTEPTVDTNDTGFIECEKSNI